MSTPREQLLCGVAEHEKLLAERDELKAVLGDLLKEHGIENLYREFKDLEAKYKILQKRCDSLEDFKRITYGLHGLSGRPLGR